MDFFRIWFADAGVPANWSWFTFGFAGQDTAHFEGEQEDAREEEGGERHLPNPMDGVLHEGWVESPEPCGPDGDAAVVAARGDFVDEWRGGGGEDAVDREDDPRGFCGIDAEELEDGGEQQWINGWDPCGGTGVSDEGISIAVSGGERAGHTTHLPAKLEMVLQKTDAVGVREGDIGDADEEGGPEDKPEIVRSEEFAALGGCVRGTHEIHLRRRMTPMEAGLEWAETLVRAWISLRCSA